VELQSYEASELERASNERFEREVANSHLEVVLLGADSIETLKKTHSRYFRSASDLTDGFKLASV
jgi:hypothetical protein